MNARESEKQMSEEMNDRPTFEPGERVRVSVVNEWTVTNFEGIGHTAAWLHVKGDDGDQACFRLTDNVTVERITPPRTWTDGDVVLNPGTGKVWERLADTAAPDDPDGRWISHRHISWLPDFHISQHVAEFGWTVLRYQAEEQGA